MTSLTMVNNAISKHVNINIATTGSTSSIHDHVLLMLIFFFFFFFGQSLPQSHNPI
ncbi:hypothetical protein Hanom_Chr17g01553501 [Helianthus anomalus]